MTKSLSNITVLFQGDSITDCERNYYSDENIGTGYVVMAARTFSAKFPKIDAKFLNRGVNGNKVRDLKSRWQKDCLDLRPNLVTILIGINDLLKVFFLGRNNIQ